MGRRSLAALGALLVLVVGALVLATVGRGGRGADARPIERDAEAPEPAALAVPAALPAAAERKGEREAVAGKPSAAVVAQALAHDVLVVEVVERDTGAPIADAAVQYELDYRAVAKAELHELLLQHRGDRPDVRTDAQGIARLELPRTLPVEVTAEAPGRFGEVRVRAEPEGSGERRARVALVADWELVVEVVDAALQPLEGVDVQCFLKWQNSASGSQETTDARGRATFARIGHELARAPGGFLELSPVVPTGERVVARVERAPADGAPVRLVLPHLGSVEATVLTLDGEPVADGTTVRLDVVRDVPRRLGEDHEAYTVGGVAVFERVGLGLELVLDADGMDGASHASLALPGPRASGERVYGILELALASTVLVFRAVDEEGVPVVGTLDIRQTRRMKNSQSSSGGDVETDAEGRFEVVVNPWVQGEDRQLLVQDPDGGLGSSVDLSRDFPLARVDMGDLVIAAAPLLAEGRVIDAEGRPVADAVVRPRVPLHAPAAGRKPFFVPVSNAGVRTAADGSFRSTGRAEGGPLRLELEHSALVADPLEVALGTRGIEIVARGAGALAGSLLLDESLSMRDLQISARRDGEERDFSQRWPMQTPGTSGSEFLIERLVPGRYTLTVALAQEVLVEMAGIEVAAFDVARDPRIQAIDLRGRLRVFELAFVTPDPGAEVRSRVEYGPPGEPDRWTRTGGHGRLVRLVTPHARLDATVSAYGFRVEPLTDLGPRTEVQLRPGWPVVLALPPELELPGHGARLGATLGDTSFFDQAPSFDGRREVHCTASEPGRTRVVWTFERSTGTSSTRGPLTLEREHFVEVQDVPGEQRFVLSLTNAELTEALAPR